MNEKTPPPKLENIMAAIKFESRPGDTDGAYRGRSKLIATLHLGSFCWIDDNQAKKHPEMLELLKKKLRHFILRQLYHEQYREIGDAVDAFMRGWTPGPYSIEGLDKDPFAIRDRLMKLAGYTPPPGFDDDEFDCGSGPNCGCEQFEFLLQPRKKTPNGNDSMT